MVDQKDLVKKYLDSSDELALEINGPWGSGKTFITKKWLDFFNEKEKDKQENEKYKYIYVSVSGLKTNKISDLFFDASLIKISENNVNDVTYSQKIKKRITSLSSMISKAKIGLDAFGFSFDLPTTLFGKLTENLIKESRFIYVIDDLERITDMESLKALFGFISSTLQEEYKSKVIILVNETEMETSLKGFFNLNKEKIINKKLKFKQNIEEAICTIIDLECGKVNSTLCEQLKKVLPSIVFNNKEPKIPNFRTIKVLVKQILEIYKEFEEEHIIVNSKEFKNDDKYKYEFIYNLVDILYKILVGIREETLEKREVIKKASNRYFNAISINKLFEYVNTGESDDWNDVIQEYTNKALLIKKQPVINTITNFRNHSESELLEAEKEIINFDNDILSKPIDFIDMINYVISLNNKQLWLADKPTAEDTIKSLLKKLDELPVEDFKASELISAEIIDAINDEKIQTSIRNVFSKKINSSENLSKIIENILNGDSSEGIWLNLKEKNLDEQVFHRISQILSDRYFEPNIRKNLNAYLYFNFGYMTKKQQECLIGTLQKLVENNDQKLDKVTVFCLKELITEIQEVTE